MTTVTEGRLEWARGETRYCVVGELTPDAARAPLVVLHGGPGAVGAGGCRHPCVQASFAQITAEPTVHHTVNGPSEFHVIGTLRDWDITDRLPKSPCRRC